MDNGVRILPFDLTWREDFEDPVCFEPNVDDNIVGPTGFERDGKAFEIALMNADRGDDAIELGTDAKSTNGLPP